MVPPSGSLSFVGLVSARVIIGVAPVQLLSVSRLPVRVWLLRVSFVEPVRVRRKLNPPRA